MAATLTVVAAIPAVRATAGAFHPGRHVTNMSESSSASGLADAAAALRAEARRADERRLLVIRGERETCARAAERALSAADLAPGATTLVGERDHPWASERVAPKAADRLLGTTRDAVVVDAHDTCRPNALGQVAGVVTGGGLLVYLAPPRGEWSATACAFHRALAVPPSGEHEVGARFHRRLAALWDAHPGVAVYDADAGELRRDGLIHPAPRLPREPPAPPDDHAFPAAAYRACRTRDQVDALAALEALREPSIAVVEADRGRGKSSAAGLAVACLAREGDAVLVTAPDPAAVEPLFERAAALLADLGELAGDAGEGADWTVRADGGGSVRYARPPDAVRAVGGDVPGASHGGAKHTGETRRAGPVSSGDSLRPDVLVVDEAAALSVRLLEGCLAADRVAFVTTVHGYEGAGRGFDVRFRSRLADRDRPVVDIELHEPVRYAPGDPVEVWAFRALALDARPAVDPLVEDAAPETTTYRALSPDELLADEHLLRETFGLLVAAHYRTEPADLARLLDAPNMAARALCHDGHVAAVALLAREGGLDAATRAGMYEGERVAGNMLPDVLTSQLRDEPASAIEGVRVLRIATHPVARSRGLGSRLLDEVAGEFGPGVEWLGVGYGATPELLRFWRRNGYVTVHLSTTRNERSGEHSALMLSPTGDRGRELCERHAAGFAQRIGAVLADPLDDLDPDVVRAALRAADASVDPALSERDWRVVVGAAYGPGLADVDPRPFRRLARAHLIDPADPDLLDARAERLLVAKVLQARPWDAVTDLLDFHSRAECMRALGRAYQPLVDAYGAAAARRERDRFTGEEP